MALIAVSTINHGKDDGSIQTFNIGDTVSGLSEDQERQLIEAGAVVETGERKYTEAPQATAGDEDTRKRDEILAKAARGENLSPAVTQAVASNSSNAAGDPAEVTETMPPTIAAASGTDAKAAEKDK